MMFLTPSELEALTGCKRPGEQVTWLTERAYRFEKRRDGLPAVLREHVRERLMDKGKPNVTITGPNWDKLTA